MAKISRTLSQNKLIADKEQAVAKAKGVFLDAQEKLKVAREELAVAKAKRA